VFLNPRQIPHPEWRIRTVGDLNHDGHPDLIWQSPLTGQLAFWLMDGTTAIATFTSNVAPPSGDWEVVGVGNSNGDGDLDLFWQQRSTRVLAVWRMHNWLLDSGLYLSASPGVRNGGSRPWRIWMVMGIPISSCNTRTREKWARGICATTPYASA
jgi:hypothetical protein